jgi:hypothetical protein
MYDVRFDDARNAVVSDNNEKKGPSECRITTVEDMEATEKSLTVVIDNIGFIDQPLETIYDLKIMRRFKERSDILKDRIKVAIDEQDEDAVE